MVHVIELTIATDFIIHLNGGILGGQTFANVLSNDSGDLGADFVDQQHFDV